MAGGLTTAIWPAESLTTVVTGVCPNSISAASARLLPVMVTKMPPPTGPVIGLMPVTVGATVGPATYVNKSSIDVADVPPVAVTVTSTRPGVPAGLTTVSDVPLLETGKIVAGLVPKSTAETSVKPFPVIVTIVPPAAGPAATLKPETVGAAM